MAESPNAPEELVPPTKPDLCAENLEKAETPQKPHDLRHQRKPREAKRSSLLENWDSLYQRHERSWERLQKLCNAPKDKLCPQRIRSLEEDMDGLLLQWTGCERRLIDTQAQLGDPTLKKEMQHLKLINEEREKLLQSSKESLQAELQAKDTPSEKAEFKVTHRSRAPSQRSHASSSFRLKSQWSQACTSVSQQSSVSGTSRSSKASSGSHSSRVSRAERLAAQASQARVEVVAAAAALRVAKAELLQKEEMAKLEAAAALRVAKAEQLQKEEMAKQRAEMAIAQARLEFLQRKREAATIVARAAVLQVKAKGAAFMANFEGPESGNNEREQLGELLVSASWEDDLIRKYSGENYQPSLAYAKKSESTEREADLWRVRRETQAEPESTTGVEEKLRQLQEERLCKVCMDKDVSVVLVPCGHLVVCAECAANLSHCPICRGDIRDSMKVFLS